MNILINANDDTLIIEHSEPCNFDLKKLRISPYELKNILEEIFNRIYFDGTTENINISLQYIDEDTSRTIGEW